MIRYRLPDGRTINENKGFKLWSEKLQDEIQYGPGYLKNTKSDWLKEQLNIEELEVEKRPINAETKNEVREPGARVPEPSRRDENQEVVGERVPESSE